MVMCDMIDDWSEFEVHHVCFRKRFPNKPAIYFLCKSNGADGFIDDVIEIVYVGKTKNLKKRIGCHDLSINEDAWLGNKFIGYQVFDCVFYKLLSNDANLRNNLEAKYIQEYYPKLNKIIPETYEVDL